VACVRKNVLEEQLVWILFLGTIMKNAFSASLVMNSVQKKPFE